MFGRRNRPAGLLPAVIAGVFGAVYFLAMTGAGQDLRQVGAFADSAGRLGVRLGLAVGEVVLSGNRYTSDADLRDALGLSATTFPVTFDAHAAQRRIEALPWVESARIDRVWPRGLAVVVTERIPAARWRDGDRLYLIDRTGRLLSPVSPATLDHLPQVAGTGAAAHAQELFDRLAPHAQLMQGLIEAERIGERRWTLHLDGAVSVHLPADREPAALANLVAILAAGISPAIGTIDLRAAGRVMISSKSTVSNAGAVR